MNGSDPWLLTVAPYVAFAMNLIGVVMISLTGDDRSLFFIGGGCGAGAMMFAWLRLNRADRNGPVRRRPAYLSAMLGASLVACLLGIAIPLLAD